MPANECIPFRGPIHAVTGQATASITGCRFVKVSADRASGPALNTSGAGSTIKVSHATAAGAIRGVSGYDAASGAFLPVFDQGTVPVEAGGTIAAGAEVEVGTNGVAVTLASGKSVGTCESGATSGQLAQIKLNIA